ncbi:MAG: IS1634 family transposase [Bacillota bacterium]
MEAADLNDDAAGCALDKLAEAGPKEVYCTVALRAALQEGVGIDVIHADTTSVSVDGAYKDDNCDLLRITYGHSKDNRPDLKQFLYGLAVTKEGVPVIGEVLDGNTSDRTWNHRMIDALRSRLGDLRELVYIADSSLVTGPNLKKMSEEGIRFISRLPPRTPSRRS